MTKARPTWLVGALLLIAATAAQADSSLPPTVAAESLDRLPAALELLRSDDILVQNEGVAAVIQIGARAVAPLATMFDELKGGKQEQVIYALSQIASPASAPLFRGALTAVSERVRSSAAVGLARSGQPDALAACLRTINDNPDQLHLDSTPSVGAIAELGPQALAPLVELMLSEDRWTRLHAQRALERSRLVEHGFQFGRDSRANERARRLFAAEWSANLSYDFDATPAARLRAVRSWRAWTSLHPVDEAQRPAPGR